MALFEVIWQNICNGAFFFCKSWHEVKHLIIDTAMQNDCLIFSGMRGIFRGVSISKIFRISFEAELMLANHSEILHWDPSLKNGLPQAWYFQQDLLPPGLPVDLPLDLLWHSQSPKTGPKRSQCLYDQLHLHQCLQIWFWWCLQIWPPFSQCLNE